jgi:formylglycine-generating enzyme required for sulfatase activity
MPPHSVTVSSFRIGKYEITQEQYATVTGINPSHFSGNTSRPVETVTWYDAVEFCNTLSSIQGFELVYSIMNRYPPTGYPITSATVTGDFTKNGFRLPTEAQWEFAARGGASSLGYTYSGANTIISVAWFNLNSGNTTHAVGAKEGNELGLYDMSGNVWEWCWDWYGSYASEAQTDPMGPFSGTLRVLHGGAWDNDASFFCTVSFRGNNNPYDMCNAFGFRVALP